MRRLGLAVALMTGMIAAGCDRAAESPAPPAPPETPATIADAGESPAAQPTSRPTEVFLYIDGKAVKFPPAIVAVVMGDPQLELMLHTDDPPEALSAKYEGNRVYLPLKAGMMTFDQLIGGEIPIRSATLEHRDVPDGIFLDGDRRQLQPYDVRIGFAANGKDSLMISISGQFVQFSTQADGPRKVVYVQGVFAAELKRRKG